MRLRFQFITVLLLSFLNKISFAQGNYWQQRVEYEMDVQLNTTTHRISGSQKLTYYNNSPDTLTKVFYHLYFNAFQPGSMMDVRSRNITDPDRRVMDRIFKLKDDEIGYQHILSLKQDGKNLTYKTMGTILEVNLAKPILPKSKTHFYLTFESQVPLQIRRSGRNNREGISYSMTQWYPKIVEYDFQGWHPYQYVAREFHSPWGDYDVKITLDPSFIVAGTGILQNPKQIGYGYETQGMKVNRPAGNLTWHFKAKNVIDFAWAADPDYTHDQVRVPNGPQLHFFYQKNSLTADVWKKLPEIAVTVFQYLNEHFGKYPFDQYSIIQGGDGGMEYPMCTLILGEGTLAGISGTMAHEIAHSWFQMTLASNEALHAWMDEGFADFSSSEAISSIVPNHTNAPHLASYASYFSLVNSGLQEPANQHSDHFNTNRSYSTMAYSMGSVFLEQLKYLVGEVEFYKGMKLYYNTWKMKHPEPNDFIRIMEKTTGLQLHWYLRYWFNTTKKIDYGIGQVLEKEKNTFVTIQRIGDFPMPIDMMVTFTDGTKQLYYIPMNELLGIKPSNQTETRIVTEVWPWVNPSYTLKISGRNTTEIESIEIDPSLRMADVNRKNNKLVFSEIKPYVEPTK